MRPTSLPRTLQLVLVWLLFSTATVCAENATPGAMLLPDGHMAQVRAEARKLIEGMLDTGLVPGFSLALVDRDGLIWMEGFGQADLEQGRPMDGHTVFRVGSLSKPLTALAVMTASENGSIHLDRPLGEQLQGFSVRTHSRLTTRITPRQLLSHRSGLPSDLHKGMYTDTPFTRVTKLLRDEYLAFTPNSVYNYSNLGYDLLGHLLQKRSGVSFQSYMRQHIFQPLGMQRSGYSVDGIARKNLASGHSQGRVQQHPPLRDTPALGLYTSAHDMSRLMQALLRQKIPGISTGTLKEIWTPQITKGQLTMGITPGLGWFIEQDPVLGKVVRHGGSTINFGAEMALLPEHGLGVVVLANGAGSNRQARQLSATILALALRIRDWPGNVPAADRSAEISTATETPSGGYATDLGLLMIDPEDPKLCACIIDRMLDMVRYEDGSLGLTSESAANLPDAYQVLGELRFRSRQQAGKEVLVAEREGEEFVLGTQIDTQPWGEEWKERIGKYRTMNPDGPFSIQDLQIAEKDGVLCLKYKVPHLSDRPIQVPLKPISNDEAVIEGLGRGRGETVRIVEVDGKQCLRFSGYMGEPVDNQ
jgi:CubicO group peptidase (beta-lactamase class C family)